MIRNLYRFLLFLHPEEFRREFAGEMLWIFEQTATKIGTLPLFGDVAASLARQWLVRSGAWPYAVGVMLNGLFAALLLWLPVLGNGPQKALPALAEPATPSVHYRLYVYMEPQPWKQSQEAERQEP